MRCSSACSGKHALKMTATNNRMENPTMNSMKNTKNELIKTALTLAMQIGETRLSNVERCVATGALLDAAEWMNYGTPKNEAVEELSGGEYTPISKADWLKAITRMENEVEDFETEKEILEDRLLDAEEATRKGIVERS